MPPLTRSQFQDWLHANGALWSSVIGHHHPKTILATLLARMTESDVDLSYYVHMFALRDDIHVILPRDKADAAAQVLTPCLKRFRVQAANAYSRRQLKRFSAYSPWRGGYEIPRATRQEIDAISLEITFTSMVDWINHPQRRYTKHEIIQATH